MRDAVVDELRAVQVPLGISKTTAFLGYDNTCSICRQLKRIIKLNENGWKVKFKNQKSTYVLTDAMSGELYVGCTRDNFPCAIIESFNMT